MFWDEPKRLSNIEDHGLDFADVRDRFEWDTALVSQSYAGKDGRFRFKAVGFFDGQLVTLVFSPRVPRRSPRSAYDPPAAMKGGSVTARRRTPPAISDAEEARIQAGITKDPYNPEITEAELARMRPAAEVLPKELYAAFTRPRGRPKAAKTKQEVKLRLDRKTVSVFKSTGAGWQTRMNDALAAAAETLQREDSGAMTAKEASTRAKAAAG